MIVCTVLGGIFAIKYRDQLHLILGFSAGTVMGVALFDLLPESFELAQKEFPPGTVTLSIAVGFILYMIIDRNFSLHSHTEEKCENPAHCHENGKLRASALVLHSFLDGLGIGLAFHVSSAIGWVVTAGVLAHKFSDGISTVGVLVGDKSNRKDTTLWLTISALAPVLGIGASYLFRVSEPVLGLILAVFVGLFLYLGASDLIPESHHKHPTVLTTIMTILGMVLIFLAVHFAG